MKVWRPSTWGDEISLEYGKALRGYELARGSVRVFGSNGPVGWTDKALARGPGVILGRKGAYRGVQYSEGDFFVIDTAYYVVPKTDLDMGWLYYAIQHHKLGEIDDGSPVPSTTRAAVYVRELAVPPRDVQQGIARVLGSIDKKIDVNRCINQTLEAMAQAIFKSWFVDFDPVKAKIAALAEGRDPLRAAMSAISGKAEVELDTLLPEAFEQLAATAALFPDEMEESALGAIPKNWAVESIREVVEGVYDGPHATPAESTNGPVFLGIRNLTGTALDLREVRHIAEVDWAQWTRRVTPRAGDIVFSYEATLGYFALLPNDLRCCLGRRLALVRPLAEQGFATFWFHQFVAPPFQRFLEKHTIPGATVNRIALKDFPSFPVLNPPFGIKAVFATRVDQMWAAIHARQDESQRLAELRDTLLPKLLSGELSVEALAESAEAA